MQAQPAGHDAGTVEHERKRSRRRRPLLVDLYCGEGGAALGYWRAGFDVVGGDARWQPRYPFPMLVMDPLEWSDWTGVAAVHAAPPAPGRARAAVQERDGAPHPGRLARTRELLRASGLPFVLVSVPLAPLEAPVLLCGATVGLRGVRHRAAEVNWPLMTAGRRDWRTTSPAAVVAEDRQAGRPARGREVTLSRDERAWRAEAGVEWMTKSGGRQAVPPNFTETIGAQLLALLPLL